MKHLVLGLLLFVGLTSQAATVQEIRSGLKIEETHGYYPHQVSQVINLVNKTVEGSSKLNVQFVAYDQGASTDVANMKTLLFTVYSYTEMKSAASNHWIANFDKIVSSKRVSGGVYEVVVSKWTETEEEIKLAGEFKYATFKYTINAAKLVADLQNLDPVEEFDSKWSTQEVLVNVSVVK